MTKPFKKIIGKIHLWLGLSSGLLVFIIAITGCIYAFQEEIQNAMQSYRFIQQQENPFLPPSEIQHIALQQLPGKHLHAIMYQDSVQAAKAIFYSFEDQYYYFVYINPYSGEVLKIKDVNADFFRFILDGHFYLWLPPQIGQPIAASATLIFFIMLISGIVLWWPKKNTNIKQKFTIKWPSGWKRKNYDFHSVLGFYISWLALILVYTGLIWGFEWFRNSAYFVTTGGDDYVEYYDPGSKEIKSPSASTPAIDRVWAIMKEEYPQADWIELHPPEDSLSSIAANANPDGSTYWKIDYRYFDQYTLEELSVPHIYNRLHESDIAQKLFRMNYDIHVGGILGLPGKIIAFLVSLTIASLPVTGFVFWLGKRNKNKTLHTLPKTVGEMKNPKTHEEFINIPTCRD